ncbi:MAG TPA: hypothetical protein VFN82_05845, partial [Solirubrobacterales bacterium]|nr:hypothetical protein [Solirubrobacterales bacterium]
GSTSPDLAVDPAGTAFAVWGWEGNYSGGEALLARIGPSGDAESPQTLLGGEEEGSGIAGIDVAREEGGAVAVWAADGAIHSRTLPLSGALGPIDDLAAPAARHYLSAPRIAVAPDDSAVVAWEDSSDYGGLGEAALKALPLAADGTPGTTRVLMAANRWDHGLRAAAGTDGAFMISWRVSVPGNNRIQAARLSDAVVGGNDDFADAEELDPELPGFSAGSNEGATKEPEEPDHAGDPGGASVWFKWTPSESGPVILSTCATGTLDPALAVYTGSSLGGLSEIGSATGGAPVPCTDGDSAVRFEADAGTTYRIAVDGQGGSEGGFGLKLLARGAAPDNDAFADATSLSGESSYRYDSNANATREPGEPDHGGVPGGASVWYSWTAPRTASTLIWACGYSLEGPLVGVYTGSAVDSLSAVEADGASSPGCAEGGATRIQAVVGTTYRIAVDGQDGREGTFQLGVVQQPANDDFGDSESLPASLPATRYGSTIAASKEPGEPDHAGAPGGASAWYSWTPSESGTAFLSACMYADEEHGALLGVYTGSELEHLTEVASDAASGTSCMAELQFEFEAGVTYRIAIDDKGGTGSSFSLYLEGLPANDDLAHAQNLGGAFPSYAYGTNRHASKEAGEPDHAGDPGGASVWYAWTPTQSGSGFVSACLQTNKSALLAVYTAEPEEGSGAGPTAPSNVSMAELREVASAAGNGPKSGCSSGFSEVSLDFAAGTTYYVAVDGQEGAQGSLTLSFEAQPANDDLADAQVLEAPRSLYSTNRHATKEAGEPDHAGDPGGASVWYAWTPEESGHGAISVCGYLGSSPLLAVYTGPDVADLTEVAATVGGGSTDSCYSTTSELEFDVLAGTTYYVAVDGQGGLESSFSLDLSFEALALNDDFASAQVLSGPGEYDGSNRDATKEPEEPAHAGDPGGASVWYAWTPTESGPVGLSTCSGGTLDPLLAVYTGSTLGSLTEVVSNDDGSHGYCGEGDSEVRFEAEAGVTYRIAVDGKGGSRGTFSLELTPAPANDQFADATELSPELPEYSYGSNRYATKEAGEPDHAGDPGGASVWYAWTPESSGTVEVSVCTYYEIEPLLAVYTGSTLTGLTPVVGTYRGADPTCVGGERLLFQAEAGVTYRIAVDAKDDEQGSFYLTLRGGTANDDFADASEIEAALPTTVYGGNWLATKEPDEPDHAGDPGGASAWFEWTPSESGPVQISTCSFGSLDPLLAVYTGTELGSLQTVAANDDGGAECSSGDSRVRFEADAGVTYRIAVDGKGGSEGEFSLGLRPAPPANDDFADAIEIPQEPTTVAGTNLDATAQTGEGYWGEQSVWSKLVATETGTVRLHTCSDVGAPKGITVFTGSSLGALSPVSTAEGTAVQCDFPPSPYSAPRAPTVAFHAVAGTTYRIAVDRYQQISPSFELLPAGPFVLVVDPPANDLRAAPEAVANTGVSLDRTNAGATREAGEGEHAGDPGGASVWFRWFAQADGPVTIDTCGSAIDTVLAVEQVGGGEVASSDDSDECGTGSTAGSAGFEAEEGRSYLIAVDGKGGETGALHLDVSFATPDSTPPETHAYIPPATNNSQLVLSATRDEPGSSFECALDGAAFAACETEGEGEYVTIYVKGLSEGSHTLAVREVDLAGNADPAPVTGEFVVDTTPPQTSIDSGPAGLTRDLGPFVFSADEPGHFQCWIDEDSPESCDTPFNASEALPDGDHVLHVRAVDLAGNVDASAATRSFHLDRTPPVVSIDGGPTGTIETDTASFEFSASEDSTFHCKLDDRPEDECESPRTYAGFADGDHLFTVTATDPAGNVGEATRAFHSENHPPQTTIDAGPPERTNQDSAEFEFGADEPVNRFECSIDEAAFASCDNPDEVSGLEDGEHLLRVRAVDTAEKADPTPAEWSWLVDTVPPDTAIASGPSGATRFRGPFDFSSDEDADHYECAVDGGAFGDCDSGYSLPFDLEDGEHTLQVRA